MTVSGRFTCDTELFQAFIQAPYLKDKQLVPGYILKVSLEWSFPSSELRGNVHTVTATEEDFILTIYLPAVYGIGKVSTFQ